MMILNKRIHLQLTALLNSPHHHVTFYFSNVYICSTLCKGSTFAPGVNSLDLHIHEYIAHSGCNPTNFHVITYSSNLPAPAPARTTRLCHHHISTGRRPIITLQMSKPPQSAMPHHISHTTPNVSTLRPTNK